MSSTINAPNAEAKHEIFLITTAIRDHTSVMNRISIKPCKNIISNSLSDVLWHSLDDMTLSIPLTVIRTTKLDVES